jgi:hypothetical protein
MSKLQVIQDTAITAWSGRLDAVLPKCTAIKMKPQAWQAARKAGELLQDGVRDR